MHTNPDNTSAFDSYLVDYAQAATFDAFCNGSSPATYAAELGVSVREDTPVYNPEDLGIELGIELDDALERHHFAAARMTGFRLPRAA